MGYTLSLPLLKKSNKAAIMAVLENFLYEDEKQYVWMSDDSEDHSYSVNLNNGIFYSYKSMPTEVHYYIWYSIALMASKFGRKKTSKLTGKKYPYFYYDSVVIYVITKEDESIFKQASLNDYDLKYRVLEDIKDINIHKRLVDIDKKYTPEEIKLSFGDNDLLKTNCQLVFDAVNTIK